MVEINVENRIPVYLTPDEAEQFLRFQRNRELFDTIESQGVMNIQYGKATFNFAGGILQNIIKEEVVYKR